MSSASDSGDDPKRVVAEGYDRVAREYARLEGETAWPRMRWLKKLLARLEAGAAVLDLGCGSGDPAGIEIAKEHRLTGVDISAAQISLARQNVPAGTFIQADAATVTFPAASFTAVVTFYTLEHLPREEHAEMLRRIHHWLHPAGFLLLSMEAEDVAGVIGEWLEVPMFFSAFDAETTKQMISDAGFEILETAVEPQIEGETEIPYLWVLAQRR